MNSPLAFVVDGTLDSLLPAAPTTALVGWLGLVLLLTAGALVVGVDLHRQGREIEVAPRGSGPRTRRAGLVLALALAAAAAFATLLRFSALT